MSKKTADTQIMGVGRVLRLVQPGGVEVHEDGVLPPSRMMMFSGQRNPSRDRPLCLCIGLEATLDEIQRLLIQASYAQLYPKIKRDAIISHGIIHHTALSQINDKLFTEGEKTLY